MGGSKTRSTRTALLERVKAKFWSRYALAAVAGTAVTTEWVTQVTREAILRCGPPREMVSVCAVFSSRHQRRR